MVKVAKFGGTSLANSSCMKRVLDIVAGDPGIGYIVLSAPGKDKDRKKVTDLLIDYSRGEAESLDIVKKVFNEICKGTGVDSKVLENDYSMLAKATEWGNLGKKLAFIQSAGERMLAKLFKKMLEKRGVKAGVYWPEQIGLYLKGEYTSASMDPRAYEGLAKALALKEGEKAIVPGFYGVNDKAEIMTFERGGSDITGAVVAKAVGAELYENWTDVDGVYSADPSVVENPLRIEEMSYFELRELAYLGAKVMHYDATKPCIEAGISMRIKNTFDKKSEGTLVSTELKKVKKIVKGIAHKENFYLFNVMDLDMEDAVGYLSKLTRVFTDKNIAIDHILTSLDTVSIGVQEQHLKASPEEVLAKIREELNPLSTSCVKDRAMVCVVGEGLKHYHGVLARISKAIAGAEVNIETISQGPSERSIIFGVKNEDAGNVVRAVYKEFFQ